MRTFARSLDVGEQEHWNGDELWHPECPITGVIAISLCKRANLAQAWLLAPKSTSTVREFPLLQTAWSASWKEVRTT